MSDLILEDDMLNSPSKSFMFHHRDIHMPKSHKLEIIYVPSS